MVMNVGGYVSPATLGRVVHQRLLPCQLASYCVSQSTTMTTIATSAITSNQNHARLLSVMAVACVAVG